MVIINISKVLRTLSFDYKNDNSEKNCQTNAIYVPLLYRVFYRIKLVLGLIDTP